MGKLNAKNTRHNEADTEVEAEQDGPRRLSSVTAALRLLKMFSVEEPELGISVLSKRMSLAKSTVHRLCAALLAEGLLEQNPDNGRYRLGLPLFSLCGPRRRRFSATKKGLAVLPPLG